MALTEREKAVAAVSSGIAVFSLAQEGAGAEGASMYDFVLKTAPPEERGSIDADLIDEVFDYVSSARAGAGGAR